MGLAASPDQRTRGHPFRACRPPRPRLPRGESIATATSRRARLVLTVVVAAALRALHRPRPLYRAQARVMIEIEDDQTGRARQRVHGARDRPTDQEQPSWSDVGFVSAHAGAGRARREPTGPDYVERERGVRRRQPDEQHRLARSGARAAARRVGRPSAMATYRERQNALSLQDSQNIVVARLNSLNDAVTARTTLAQKESLYDQAKGCGGRRRTNPDPAETLHPVAQVATWRTWSASAPISERYGERHPRNHQGQRQHPRLAAAARDRDHQGGGAIRNDYQTALAEERRSSASLEDQKAPPCRLSRKNVSYTVLEREAQSNRQVYETLSAAAEGAAGAGQQPRQQRPAGRTTPKSRGRRSCPTCAEA